MDLPEDEDSFGERIPRMEQHQRQQGEPNSDRPSGCIITTTLIGLVMVTLVCFWLGQYAEWTDGQVNGNIHIIMMANFFIFFHGLVNVVQKIFPDTPTLKVTFFHFFLHLIVIVGVSIGLFFAVRHHQVKGDWHCYTFHSWVGLLAIILYFIQFLVFLVKFTIFLVPFTPMGIRKLILPQNEFLGPLIFLLSVAASVTGIMMKADNNLIKAGPKVSKYEMSSMTINSAGISILIFSIVIIYALRPQRS